MVLRRYRYHGRYRALVSCVGVLGDRGNAILGGSQSLELPVPGHHKRSGQFSDFERLPLKKGLYLVKASREFLDAWRTTRMPSKKAREVAELRDHSRRILCARSQAQALDLLASLRRRHSSDL